MIERAKVSWSGFISLDGRDVNEKRLDLLDAFRSANESKRVLGEKGGLEVASSKLDFTWRTYVGDALSYLMKNSDSKEVAELLVRNGYLDINGYVRAAASFGLSRQEAMSSFRKITLEGKA
ncbi:hypothetical protein [Acinetobacter sp. P1(2025)]|uniref:hypothetical protein n=1 Tax=Acinetobacter sp. P1(2025) TaxID=3446120 RepID=UPI003F52C845